MSSVPFSVFVAEGDSFADLYREFYPRVLRVCRYILGSHEDAEDASSEVFARLPRAIKTYNRALPFSRWLASVASHYCIDVLRRKRAEQRVIAPVRLEEIKPVSPRRSALDEILSAEERESVREAIARLPKHYRAPLELRYYGDMSYEEIGRSLRIKPSNAKTLVFRARKEVRLSLERMAVR